MPIRENQRAFYFGSLGCGVVVMLLGISVIIGWHIGNVTLIQFLPTYVAMQYNAAVAFVFCGLGLMSLIFHRFKAATILGALVSGIGIATVLEYLSGVDLRIDRLLMEPYVTIGTSSPGRMAPNAATCFALSGLSIIFLSRGGVKRWPFAVASFLGAITFALGTIAIFGYLGGIPTAFGWGQLTRMAIHTSVGFIVLGSGLILYAWRNDQAARIMIPFWLPIVLGVSVMAIAFGLWQALLTMRQLPKVQLNIGMTTFAAVIFLTGLFIALLLTLVLQFARTAQIRSKETEQLNRDLTQEALRREKTEFALLEKEKLLSSAQRMARLGSWIWEIPENKVIWSEELYRIFGIDPESFSASYEAYLNLLHPDDTEKMKEVIATTLANSKPFEVEHRLIRPNGDMRVVHSIGELVRDEKGTPIRLVGTAQDITRRKELEVALRDSQSKFERLFELSPDAIVVVDARGHIVMVNDQTQKLFGYARNELVGQPVERLMPERFVHRHIGHRADFAAHPRVRAMGAGLELFGLRKDGTEFSIDIMLSPVTAAEGTLVIATVRDISKRIKAEEELKRFSTILESTPDFVGMADASGQVFYVNKAGRSMAGLSESEEITHYTISDFHPEQISHLIFQEAMVIARDKGVWRAESVLRRRDGQEIPVLQLILSHKGKDGKIRFFSTLMRDITERKNALNQIEASLKEKEVLLREIHHRVKNNMQIISSLLRLQSSHIQDVSIREMYRESQDRIQTLALIHEKLYKSENLMELDFGDYARDLIDGVHRAYADKAGNIESEIKHDPAMFKMDTALPVGLILTELASNCYKHAFPKGQAGILQIELRGNKEQGYLLTVRDNGVGLERELKPNETQTLGLRLIHILVEQINGTVEFESRNGTCVKIKFPDPEKRKDKENV